MQSAFTTTLRHGIFRVVVNAACAIGACHGCTNVTPSSPPVAHRVVSSDPPGDLQCTSEKVTGSLVATRVCTLKSQRDEIREHTQDARDALNNQVIAACPGTPGCK